MKEERKLECLEKTPDGKLQKMPHTKAREFKPQPRLKPTLWQWWQARKADMLTITPCVAPKSKVYLYHLLAFGCLQLLSFKLNVMTDTSTLFISYE